MLEYTEESKAPSPDTHRHIRNHRDNDDDIPYDLVCTKYLGTLRTMAYSPARSASPAPVEAATAPLLPAASPTRLPPLNANVFRGPPSHHSLSPSSSRGGSNGSSPAAKPPLARFVLSTVGLLRVVAGALTIAVVVLQITAANRSYYRTSAPLFIFLAFVQLSWHLLALLAEECASRGRGRGGRRRRRPLRIDLGFVTCIFGRPSSRDEDGAAGGDEYVLTSGWVPGGERMGKWSKRSLLFSAIDFVVAWCAFSIALTADLSGSYIWGWINYHEISILSFIIFALDIIIAFAGQVNILKRAKIQISHADGDDEDEEDDVGSRKYRIRLPQSPEQRHAAMSVAA